MVRTATVSFSARICERTLLRFVDALGETEGPGMVVGSAARDVAFVQRFLEGDVVIFLGGVAWLLPAASTFSSSAIIWSRVSWSSSGGSSAFSSASSSSERRGLLDVRRNVLGRCRQWELLDLLVEARADFVASLTELCLGQWSVTAACRRRDRRHRCGENQDASSHQAALP